MRTFSHPTEQQWGRKWRAHKIPGSKQRGKLKGMEIETTFPKKDLNRSIRHLVDKMKCVNRPVTNDMARSQTQKCKTLAAHHKEAPKCKCSSVSDLICFSFCNCSLRAQANQNCPQPRGAVHAFCCLPSFRTFMNEGPCAPTPCHPQCPGGRIGSAQLGNPGAHYMY